MPGHRADGAGRAGLPGLVARAFPAPRNPALSPRLLAAALASLPFLGECAKREPPAAPAEVESVSLRSIREIFPRIQQTLGRNHRSFDGPSGKVSGFGAGDIYPQIWLRDSAWIVDAASASYPAEDLTSWLDLHLANATASGRLRDWVARGSADTFREWAPRVAVQGNFVFDTNSNESDQEPSAALAYCRIDSVLPPASLGTDLGRSHRFARVSAAMDALLRDRTDAKSGLIWSGLTADFGDVSPLYPDQRSIYLDARTPRTLSLYSNVMTAAALECLAGHETDPTRRETRRARAEKLKERIRSRFWLKDRGYFRIRLTLDPVAASFGAEEDDRFALAGNALAALYGVADDAQAASIFQAAERLRTANRLSTVSTTLIPPYRAGIFKHPSMREPFQYQNGGQWDWFGAALVQAEFERGHSALARAHLDQIVARALRSGPGLHEWYAQDGSPQGSPAYAASAAALYNAVVKGLLGLTFSPSGDRLVLRAGETLLPFETPNRAAFSSLTVSQAVGTSTIDVVVRGDRPLLEVCSVLPPKVSPGTTEPADPHPQSVRRLGEDTLMCADVSRSTLPLHARFRFHR